MIKMNKKYVKSYSPSTPGQFLETTSFSPSPLSAGDIIVLAIDENFYTFYVLIVCVS